MQFNCIINEYIKSSANILLGAFYNSIGKTVKNMKKTVAVILLLLVVFCGCARTSPGNTSELTQYVWTASLKGGGEVRLELDGETARLEMSCGGEKEVIEGRYLADETSFVIFDSDAEQNYRFEYVPRGKKLDLTYKSHTIEMQSLP